MDFLHPDIRNDILNLLPKSDWLSLYFITKSWNRTISVFLYNQSIKCTLDDFEAISKLSRLTRIYDITTDYIDFCKLDVYRVAYEGSPCEITDSKCHILSVNKDKLMFLSELKVVQVNMYDHLLKCKELCPKLEVCKQIHNTYPDVNMVIHHDVNGSILSVSNISKVPIDRALMVFSFAWIISIAI